MSKYNPITSKRYREKNYKKLNAYVPTSTLSDKAKASRAARSKRYYDKNAAKIVAYSRKWKQDNKEQAKKSDKNWQLKRYYGISLEDYNKLLEQQKGCCAICKKNESKFKKGLVVDHDHKTGEVRSLLCPNCNFAIGYAQEDIVILEAMIKYLDKSVKNNYLYKIK